MFKALARKPRGKVIAVADVGGGSTGVAIVALSSREPARVVVAAHADLPIEGRSRSALATRMLTQLGETAQKTLSAYSARTDRPAPHVSSAYCILRAPWSRSKTIRTEWRFREETRIDSSMITTLAQEALKSEKSVDPATNLEASVVRVELNGYPTGKPEGKRARELVVSMLFSNCDPAIRSGVSEALSRTFGCPPPTLRSGTRAILSVLRESNLLPKDCLIVNMATDGSTMVAIRSGVVSKTALIPEGTHSIVRRIAGEKMPEETLALIRMLALDHCELEACESTKAALARAEPDLAKIYGEAMSGMASAQRLPNALVLTTHEDLSPWMLKFFSRIDFAQFTVTTQPFIPRALHMSDLANLIAVEAGATPNIDLSVASALVTLEVAGN